MTRPPTAAQRRVIDAADSVTGRLRGTESQLAALVRHGLAFRHSRPPHDHFLTPAGHRIREAPIAAVPSAPKIPEPAREPSGVFTARVGGEEATDAGPSRVREVHSAWQGLLELRRMTNTGGAVDRPCAWERTHLTQAAALALEAAGLRPAGADTGTGTGTGTGTEGYRVRATPQPEAVAVREPDARALKECAVTLEKAGWQVSEHAEPRTGARYLLASPRRS
ncbi:hypothetical protein AB0D14_06395 [Streptomyces sp. NPDC048484]|uniref:hypothetical protein n=1 Tax=Streptomyces sp. NPDC048484 TaxID=3155146 RepID=UPI003426538F